MIKILCCLFALCSTVSHIRAMDAKSRSRRTDLPTALQEDPELRNKREKVAEQFRKELEIKYGWRSPALHESGQATKRPRPLPISPDAGRQNKYMASLSAASNSPEATEFENQTDHEPLS